MRTKATILEQVEYCRNIKEEDTFRVQSLILEVLIDIRDLYEGYNEPRGKNADPRQTTPN